MDESKQTFTHYFDLAVDSLMRQLKNKDLRYMQGFLDGVKYYLDYHINILEKTKEALER